MQKYLQYCDMNESLLHDPVSMLGHDKDIKPFHRKLLQKLGKLREQILVLDFEDIYVFNRPQRFVEKTFQDIVEKTASFPVLGINANPEVLLSLNGVMTFRKILFNKKTVFPIFGQIGDITWLGVENNKISQSLTLIFWEREIDSIELSRQFKLSAQQLKDLIKVVRTNPHFFEYVKQESKESFRLTFDRSELSDLLRERFERRFKKEVNKLQMELKGHFNLPCGKHTNSYFITSMIINNPQLVRRIALEIIRRFSGKDFEIIVSCSLLGLYLAKEICDIKKNVEYIVTYGYPTPLPRFGEKIRRNKRVLIITDAICSGRSLAALEDFVNIQGGIIAGSIAAFDTAGLQGRLGNDAIFSYPNKTYTIQNCKSCKEKEPLYDIDAFTSIPRHSQPDKAETLKDSLSPDAFWDWVLKSRALKQGHWSFNGHHFSIFIETNKLLKNKEYLRIIADKVVNHYSESFDFIIYPSHESAFLLAQAIAESLTAVNPKKKPFIIPTSKNKLCNAYVIPYHYEGRIEDKEVLVVDDGANFGETLIGINFLLEKLRPKSKNFCVLVDRLTGIYRENVNRIVGGDNLFSLFYLPHGAYHSEDCPTCKERRNTLIEKETQLASLVDLDKQNVRTKLNFVEGKWIS